MILDEKNFHSGQPRTATMISALSNRSSRLGLVAAISVLTLFFFYWNSGWTADAVANPWQRRPFDHAEISEYAHRLPYADAFLGHPGKDEGGKYIYGHFDNVTMLPTVTMDEAKAPCHWDDPSKVNFAFGETSGWGMDLSWTTKDRGERELRTMRNQIYDFISNKNNSLIPYDFYADRFEGRGIVIVGGQGRSLKRVRVILRQLKHLGCKLPVELHYWGAEMDSAARKELTTMWPNIYFSNIANPANIMGSTYNRMYGIHYHLKIAALINARFEHILLLDSDNIPVIDPEELFDSKVYQEYGTVFWPDIQRTRANNPLWPITNTQCRSVEEWELESGQLLVNKKKFFYHLQLAGWFITPDTEHGNYFHHVMLGDKDAFRFAWHALKTKFGVPSRWITSIGTYNDGFYCGHTFAQHHPDPGGPVAFLHGGLLKTMRREVVIWQKQENGGIFQYYKREPHDEDKTSNTNVGIKWDAQDYLPNKPEGMEAGWCTDFYDVQPRPFSEVVPASQFSDKIFDEIGGYWMIEDDTPVSITDGNL